MSSRKTVLAVTLAGGFLGSGWAVAATVQPIPVTAHVTADNHYALYVGNAAGTDLVFIGRNEKTTQGNPGRYNWSLPEEWAFDMSANEYIYLVAWNDGPGQRMAIADFHAPGAVLVTNREQWEGMSIPQTPPPAPWGDVVLTDVLSAIAGGEWSSPTFEAANDDTSSWNDFAAALPGVLQRARFIWYGDSEYVVFRAAAPLPPPPTCSDQLAAAEEEIDTLTEELAAAQAQIADLESGLAQAQQQLDSLNGSIATLVASIEADFRQSFRDPMFVLPGADPLEQLENLVMAITGLQHGSKLQVYRGVGGQPGKK